MGKRAVEIVALDFRLSNDLGKLEYYSGAGQWHDQGTKKDCLRAFSADPRSLTTTPQNLHNPHCSINFITNTIDPYGSPENKFQQDMTDLECLEWSFCK